MKKLLLLASVAIVPMITSSCATNNSAKVRAQRPITVGLSTGGIGGMYRPNDTFAFGATTGGTSGEAETLTIYSPANRKALGAEEFGILESQTSSTNIYAHYYPWKDSAFYMGLRIKQQEATFVYEVDSSSSSLGFTGEDISLPDDMLSNAERGATNLAGYQTPVSLATSSTQIKIPIGWSWIWENGISFMLELGGPVIGFTQNSTYNIDGEAEGVNTTKRDILATELIDTVGKDSAVSPFLNFGYSF